MDELERQLRAGLYARAGDIAAPRTLWWKTRDAHRRELERRRRIRQATATIIAIVSVAAVVAVKAIRGRYR